MIPKVLSPCRETFNWRWIFALSLAAILFESKVWAVARPQKTVYAVVLGFNKSDNPQLQDLQFADDDAVKNANLIQSSGGTVFLHSELDADSRKIYPSVSPLPPTLEALSQSFETINELIEKDRERGLKPILYVFLSAHGEVAQNQGFLYVQSGLLERKRLLRWLAESKAYANHLIIDACKSYFMVFKRGPGGERTALEGTMELENLSLLDNTGVFLSTSSATLSHEWEAYQAGIFSHQLRSAMRGAADLNADSRLSYKEAAAFIWNANQGIENSKYRNQVFVHQPSNPQIASEGLFALPSHDILQLQPGLGGHYYLEDQKGERLVDFHSSLNQTVQLFIRQSLPIFLRDTLRAREMQLDRFALSAEQSAGAWHKRRITTRGAEHEAFAQLFRTPFWAQTLVDFDEDWQRQRMVLEVKSQLPAWRIATGVLGIGGILLGSQALYAAHAEHEKIPSQASSREVDARNRKISTLNQTASASLSLGLAAAIAYGIWPYIADDADMVRVVPYIEDLSVMGASPAVGLSFHF